MYSARMAAIILLRNAERIPDGTSIGFNLRQCGVLYRAANLPVIDK